jgi:aminopeptidase N
MKRSRSRSATRSGWGGKINAVPILIVCMDLLLANTGCHLVTRTPRPSRAASASAPPAREGEDPLDIRRYETEIAIDMANKSISGETAVVFSYSGPGPRELRFPRNGLSVDGIRYESEAATYHVDADAIIVQLPDASPSADERVTIAYHGTPERELVFGEKLVYSNFFTCHWMVCSEEPGDKAAFGIEVVAPAGYRVIASGHLVEERIDESGRVHSRWEEQRPYSPYLYGFVAGELIEADANAGSVGLRFFGLAASESADSLQRKFRDTGRMMAFLQSRAGIPPPHDVYTQILVPGAEAQEKSSFALIGTEFLDPILEDPTEDWVIVHELAHQWWGNLITCRDWSDFWLNEATATFLVAAYKEQRWGRASYERELGLWQEHWGVAKSANFDVPLAYAGKYPSLRVRRAIQYSKGALFLHALRGRIGERGFWAGIEAFTRQHAGGTVTSADFQSAMQGASGVDLAALFREWVYP